MVVCLAWRVRACGWGRGVEGLDAGGGWGGFAVEARGLGGGATAVPFGGAGWWGGFGVGGHAASY